MLSKDNAGRFKPGESANPGGRPRGSTSKKLQVRERILGKWRTHPVDRLVEIANYLQDTGKFEEAAQIWTNLLKYFEPTKKPIEVAPEKTTPDESREAAEETFRLLQELENNGFKPTHGSTQSGEGNGMETGAPVVSPKTSSETDLPGHTE